MISLPEQIKQKAEKHKWYHVKDHPNRGMFFSILEGKKLIKIKGKVWRLDDGSWAYAINSDEWKNKKVFFLGREPSRIEAIKTANLAMNVNGN